MFMVLIRRFDHPKLGIADRLFELPHFYTGRSDNDGHSHCLSVLCGNERGIKGDAVNVST
jgi:hypothetical protein